MNSVSGTNFVNSLLFPTPESGYEFDSFPDKELIWLPRSLDPNDGKLEDNVPCLFLTSNSARFLMLYLHSNAEDLGRCYHFCNMLRLQFQVNVLAVEYPGYGVCPGGQADEESVIENARLAYRFITEVMQFPPEDIIVIGRSVGSGPALCLASEHRVYGVILICPFLSVKEVVRCHLGRLADLIDERFPNQDRIKRISGSLLIVHGKKDAVVPWTQGDALYEACPRRKRLVTPEDMTHNASLLSDPGYFVLPVLQFFGLPDYNFEPPRLPDWVHDPRMCPYYGKDHDTVHRISRRLGEASIADGLALEGAPRSKSVPGRKPGAAAGTKSGPRARCHGSPPRLFQLDTPSPEPEVLESVVQAQAATENSQGTLPEIADAAVHRYLAWQVSNKIASEAKKQQGQSKAPEDVPEDEEPVFGVNCSAPSIHLLAEAEERTLHSPADLDVDTLPSPPDDSGFFKVPRSQNAGPSLTAPIKLPKTFDAGITSCSDRTCDWAPSWIPGLCSLAPRRAGAMFQESVTVTAQGSESDQAVWRPWTGPAGPRPAPAMMQTSTRRPYPAAAATVRDPMPDDPEPDAE
eukprot:gb/GFBE01003488.1/.p1 GENE.gb/GFBE01003488.1/~~gb/GFBE01003488.1/.p1  ORF type:complete len:576 (+),score=80.64 gb/GFBE01003488.1/:1-1728(+)